MSLNIIKKIFEKHISDSPVYLLLKALLIIGHSHVLSLNYSFVWKIQVRANVEAQCLILGLLTFDLHVSAKITGALGRAYVYCFGVLM
ncbi:hypothetical protein ACJX0J_014148, partial [Zea mays]